MTALERLRKRAGLTRYELQRDSGISDSTIRNIERGGAQFQVKTIRLLADGLSKHLPLTPRQIAAELLGFEPKEEEAEKDAVLA